MMQPVSLQQLARWCAGTPVGADVTFTAVTTDSRKVTAGDLFVALRGERFDGHAFIADVAAQGAVAALVDTVDATVDLPQVQVPDTVQALGQLAAAVRQQFQGPLLALTGSAGKTTTKEMIAAILAVHGNPMVTAGNLNNHIGVPLTLLRLEPQHSSAVIEMGASGLGEIRYLTQMARPQVALVTNVSAAHVEGFGSLENVALGKSEIFAGLATNGVAVINLDNVHTASWLDRVRSQFRVLTVSARDDREADVFARQIHCHEKGIRFTLCHDHDAVDIEMAFLGRHNVNNALMAAAACLALGVSLATVASGLAAARPYQRRLQRLHGLRGCVVIDDSYNANPASMKMAIDTLMACQGQRYLVLGDMGELGADARALHAEIGRYAREAGVEHLLVCGELSRATAEAFGTGAQHHDDWQSLRDACLALADKDVVFLIKGSRSAGMDRIADALTDKVEN